MDRATWDLLQYVRHLPRVEPRKKQHRAHRSGCYIVAFRRSKRIKMRIHGRYEDFSQADAARRRIKLVRPSYRVHVYNSSWEVLE